MSAACRHEGEMSAIWNCRNDRGFAMRVRFQKAQLVTYRPGFNATKRAIRRHARRRRPTTQLKSLHAYQEVLQSAFACGIAPQNCHDCDLSLFLNPR
jgi:hypothetical protein